MKIIDFKTPELSATRYRQFTSDLSVEKAHPAGSILSTAMMVAHMHCIEANANDGFLDRFFEIEYEVFFSTFFEFAFECNRRGWLL